MRLIIALLGALLLAGCTTTQGPSNTVPIDIGNLPPSIAAPCARPVKLPTADTGRQDVERYWGTDRTNEAKCAARQAAVVGAWDRLRRNLAGAGK